MYSQYTGNTGSISTEELHTVASKAGTTKLALPQRKLATGELLPRRRRRRSLLPPPQLAATAAMQWLCREKLRSFPSVRVRSCVRSYVRVYVL